MGAFCLRQCHIELSEMKQNLSFFFPRITGADPAMVTLQLAELKQKELIAEMEDGKKVVRHVLHDDKTGYKSHLIVYQMYLYYQNN